MSTALDVLITIDEGIGSLERTLEGIEEQTLPVHQVWITASDPSVLPGSVPEANVSAALLPPGDPTAPNTIVQATPLCDCEFIAMLSTRHTPSPTYVETLVEVLEEQRDWDAVGGQIEPDPTATEFQKTSWGFMNHVLGAGGTSDQSGVEGPYPARTTECAVYRRETLIELDTFPDDRRLGQEIRIQHCLRQRHHTLARAPEAICYIQPPAGFGEFLRLMDHLGRTRGQLARDHITATKRHRIVDQLLLIWSFGLVWNPIGWGFGLFYSLFLVVVVIQQWTRGRGGTSLVLLFPTGQLIYWLGWLSGRFASDPLPSD